MSSTKNGNSNGNGSIPAGDIRFYDNYLPPLEGGDYVVTAQQSVQSITLAPSGKPLDKNFPDGAPVQQAFTVVAPRVALDPADIYSLFPPASALGTFEQNLPHIVLTKRNLPWERLLSEKDKTKTTPWMAVLLFSPDEIIAPVTNPPPSSTLANPSRAGTYNLPDVLKPPTGTLGPALTEEYEDMLGQVTSITLTNAGTGYTSTPTVEIAGGGGTGAAATAQVQNGTLSLTLTARGKGYTSDPLVTIQGGGGTGAQAVAHRGLVCMAIDITTETFTKVTPRFEPDASPAVDELKYLAHCRQVNTGDKEVSTTKDDGWFSVVIGNRFPAPGAGPVLRLILDEGGLTYTSAPVVEIQGDGTGAQAVAQIDESGTVVSLTLTQGGTGYTKAPTVSFSGGGGTQTATATAQIGAPWVAHLVSLEGFADYLVDSPTWPVGTERVRLVSLYSWNFTCLSESGDFQDLMLNLIAGQAKGGAGLLLRLPVTNASQPAGSVQATVQGALNQGYAALSYETMIGDDTFAWYRGPLATAPRTLFSNSNPYTSASSAMIYDEKNALFDQSYSTAWQTGRLLALADKSFGAKLLQWRRKANATVNLLAARLNSSNVKALVVSTELSASSSAETVAQLRGLLKRDLISSSYMNHLLGDFSEGIATEIARSAPLRNSTRDVSSSGTEPRASNLEMIKQLYSHPAVQQLLLETSGGFASEQSGTDPTLDYIVSWLADLRLLYGVPFVNLVPDARMLPKESLRFFFVDPNYLEALIAGALSIGMQSSRDQVFQSLMHGSVSAASQRAALLVRDKRMRRAPQTANVQMKADVAQTGQAGFLLRSAVVADWPGLEVRAYSDTGGTQQLKLARMDRLAPDLLLCLFPQTTARIEISEPKEGLAFGHEDEFAVDLRWVSGDSIGSVIQGQSVKINGYFRSQDPAPVLNVSTWQPYLQSQLSRAYGGGQVTLGPADFAIQMVRAPEELVLLHS